MTDEPRKNTKPQLALAIAPGDSVAAWACTNGVPRRTAFRWAMDPSVRNTGESSRRRTIEDGIRRLIKQSAWVADRIAMLAKSAESDSVKQAALRAILGNMTASPRPELRTTNVKRRGFLKPTANERHLPP
jgi:hypothetical protein